MFPVFLQANNAPVNIFVHISWFPRWLSGIKNPLDNAGDAGDSGSIPGLGKSHIQCSCLEKSYGQRSLVGSSSWGRRESDMTEHTRTQHTHTSYVKVKVAQLCPTLCNPLDCSPWNSPGQNTGVGSLSLLPGIFPTQGSNPGLPHCRQVLYQLSHQGSLNMLAIYI